MIKKAVFIAAGLLMLAVPVKSAVQDFKIDPISPWGGFNRGTYSSAAKSKEAPFYFEIRFSDRKTVKVVESGYHGVYSISVYVPKEYKELPRLSFTKDTFVLSPTTALPWEIKLEKQKGAFDDPVIKGHAVKYEIKADGDAIVQGDYRFTVGPCEKP